MERMMRMAEQMWNMLKLVPSISASRKNSLITGLARIDDNTEELILSLYHLPDPKEFVDVKDATYYAWKYDSEENRWGVIGELQKKNGLTFSFKKRVKDLGDGIFITAESEGTNPLVPGEVVLSSNTELFYQDLRIEPEVEKAQPVAERRPPVEENQPEPEKIIEVMAEEREEEKSELQAEPVFAQPHKPERNHGDDDDYEDECEEECADWEDEHDDYHSHDDHDDCDCDHDHDDCDCDHDCHDHHHHDNDDHCKDHYNHDDDYDHDDEFDIADKEAWLEKLSHFYSDLDIDDALGLIKDRYSNIKNEVNLRHYWNKCKDYCHDFYEDTKLKNLYEEVKDDLQDFIDKIDLDDLWCKIEEFLHEMMDLVNVKKWAHKAKEWIDEIDIHEWYCKMKDYVDAILDEVDVAEFWYKVKCWVNNLLEMMSIDDMIVWIKVKIYAVRNMSGEELKAEVTNLFKQFADQIQMPELKMAVVKVAFREKLSQVGSFFKRMKNKVEGNPKVTNESAREKTNPKAGVAKENNRPAQFGAGWNQQPQAQAGYNQYHVTDDLGANYNPAYHTEASSRQMYNPNRFQVTPEQQPQPKQQKQSRQQNAQNQQQEINSQENLYYQRQMQQMENPYYQQQMNYNPYQRQAYMETQYPNYQQNMMQHPSYQQYMMQNPYYQNAYYQQPAYYSQQQNPAYWQERYPMMEAYGDQTGHTRYPCSCQCQNCYQFGYDAMGDPRYVYDDEDEDYYFITPDGEIIRKS